MPADDLTDPAPATTYSHLDATAVLSRDIASQGIYPAVDPLESTSRILTPEIVGQEHYDVARRVQQVLQRYKELQDIIAIMGMDELSEERQTCSRSVPRKVTAFPVTELPCSGTVYWKSGTVCTVEGDHPWIQDDPGRRM